MSVIEIEEQIDAIVAKDFNDDDFVFDFMEAFDAPKATVKQLRQGQQNASDISGILWRRNLHYIQSRNGLVRQALEKLQASKETIKQKVRYIVSTDGHEFGARDLKTGETLNCLISELGLHFGFFLPLANIERYKIADENPVDIKATGRLAKLYDAILMDNPTWKGDEKRHALNHFMTQIVFCLFAEDTGIFAENLFSETIVTYCETDSAQAKTVLTNVFTAMSLSEDYRSDCPAYAKRFPFVNGGLFKGEADVPRLTRGSVRYLIDAGQLDWRDINPDIFGSMIQSIVNEDQRGELGMHYTSVPNILKVLDPLFLDELREQVLAGWDKNKSLKNVLDRLSKIRVFDPACGSGNFLVIAYRELRKIEIKVISRLAEIGNYSAPLWSHVKLANFYGIEYADFAAETARLSLWIAEYQMNSRYETAFGRRTPALPLKDTGNIFHGNALQINWARVCAATGDPETKTYIVGNPPYLGDKLQSDEQKTDLKKVFAESTDRWKSLDYVAGWFKLASSMVETHDYRAAFVSTNSIAQGQQAPTLMPMINNDRVEIFFAHSSFVWKNNAADRAGVICVILGIRRNSSGPKWIYDGSRKRKVSNINHYLFDAQNVVVESRREPVSRLPDLVLGNMPKDGGHLIMSIDEAEGLIRRSPEAAKFIKTYGGSMEFIKGGYRACLWIEDNEIYAAEQIPEIAERLRKVEVFRLQSKKKETRGWASSRHRFVEIRSPSYSRALIIPRVSSIRRPYLPFGYAPQNTIVSDSAYALYDPPEWTLALIGSRLHLLWISTVCGKLKNDFRYSNTMGWNTFPVPNLNSAEKTRLKNSAEEILLARDEYFEMTISELYDPNRMAVEFPTLMDAHIKNDKEVETIFNGSPFKTDTLRLEHLFQRFSQIPS